MADISTVCGQKWAFQWDYLSTFTKTVWFNWAGNWIKLQRHHSGRIYICLTYICETNNMRLVILSGNRSLYCYKIPLCAYLVSISLNWFLYFLLHLCMEIPHSILIFIFLFIFIYTFYTNNSWKTKYFQIPITFVSFRTQVSHTQVNTMHLHCWWLTSTKPVLPKLTMSYSWNVGEPSSLNAKSFIIPLVLTYQKVLNNVSHENVFIFFFSHSWNALG